MEDEDYQEEDELNNLEYEIDEEADKPKPRQVNVLGGSQFAKSPLRSSMAEGTQSYDREAEGELKRRVGRPPKNIPLTRAQKNKAEKLLKEAFPEQYPEEPQQPKSEDEEYMEAVAKEEDLIDRESQEDENPESEVENVMKEESPVYKEKRNELPPRPMGRPPLSVEERAARKLNAERQAASQPKMIPRQPEMPTSRPKPVPIPQPQPSQVPTIQDVIENLIISINNLDSRLKEIEAFISGLKYGREK